MEAPLSRVEAILQNILGADNVLVPPQSRVEEILLAILNNTEYIHPGDPSRVEEILLAIKDGGSYDKQALSRVEDILIHKLNDDEYTDYSEDDLSRVEKLLIQWIDLHPEVIKELTTSSFPISILANGLPLLDYTISGNTTQSGTPTPDSPVMPQGTGERSAQLIPYPFYSSDGEYAGVQFTTDNGRIIANGALTSGLLYYLWRPAKFLAGKYTMSVKGKHSGATIYFRDTTNNVTVAYIYGAQEGDRSVTFTLTEEISAMVYINATSGSVDFDCTIMLNAGEEALPFEPTNGYKIPISSANTTTPVYLGEVETTRRIRKLVLTGEENFSEPGTYPGGYLYLFVPSVIAGDNGANTISTHYKQAYNNNGQNVYIQTHRIAIIDATHSTTADFKAYLAAQYAAGTPVTVWYVLATEETAVVNEPLMKIGDYVDTLSMEQAGVEIPTLKKPNTTVIDAETDVEPSSMYLKYSEPSDGPTPKTPVLGTKDREIYVTSNNEIYVLRR